jgi:Phage tail protein
MAEDIRNVNPITQSYENKKVNVGLSPVPVPIVTGLELKADISLNGLTLNTIDSNGVVWVCTDIEGWWSQPDPEFQDLTRGWGDGSYDVRGRWAARQLTLTGSFLTPDNSYVPAARDTLIRATSLVYDGGWLVVKETPIAKASFVRISGKPDIKTVNARGRTDFSIGLRAPDPIKYEWVDGQVNGYNTTGKKTSNSGSFTINNLGNVKVPIVIRITGSVSPTADNPYILQNTTRLVSRYDGTSTPETIKIVGHLSGDQFELDTYNKEILESNSTVVANARNKMDVLSDWIYLDPGVNTLTWTGPGNGASVEILYRSGWIG